MSGRQFWTVTHPYGQTSQATRGQRVDVIRRLECPTCKYFVINNWPFDEAGNSTPKYLCQLLDIDNQKIQEENLKRHPTEQLKYLDCVFGPLENTIPKFPRNASDYVTQR